MRVKVSWKRQKEEWFRLRRAALRDCPGLEDLTKAALDRIYAKAFMRDKMPCTTGK